MCDLVHDMRYDLDIFRKIEDKFPNYTDDFFREKRLQFSYENRRF